MKTKKVLSLLAGTVLSFSLFGSSVSAATSYVDPSKDEAALKSTVFGVTLLTVWVDGKFWYTGTNAGVESNAGNYAKTAWSGTTNIRDFRNDKAYDSEYHLAKVYTTVTTEAGAQIGGVGWVWDTKTLTIYQQCAPTGATSGWTTTI